MSICGRRMIMDRTRTRYQVVRSRSSTDGEPPYKEADARQTCRSSKTCRWHGGEVRRESGASSAVVLVT
ncbi:hypothetical protein TNCV_4786611 [Trichonephila clavipes]|nr:hypothetical protein TNCV_4786611 [Trichonephila clavipes]